GERQQEKSEDLDEQRNESDGEATKAGDESCKEHACDDEGNPVDGKGKSRAAPVEIREIESDESGQDAEAESAKGQRGAVRGDLPEDVRERQLLFGANRNARQAQGEKDRRQRQKKNEEAGGGESPALLKQNAERRAEGKRGEGGDAVPGDNFCDVRRAGAADS